MALLDYKEPRSEGASHMLLCRISDQGEQSLRGLAGEDAVG